MGNAECCKRYYQKNKDKISKYKKRWYLKNRERILDYITNLEQVNKNQAKRNSRQRLANQKQQELILKLQQENERLKKPDYHEKGLIGSIKERDEIIQDYKSRCEKAYEELTYMSSSDYVEDYDIKQKCWIKLSNILQNGGKNND